MRRDGLPDPSNHSEMYLAAILDELRLSRDGEPQPVPDPNQGTLDLEVKEPAPKETAPKPDQPIKKKGK